MKMVGTVEHYDTALTLVKTTTQLYGLSHAKAKTSSYLFHKNTGFYNNSWQLQMNTHVVIG